MGHMTELGIAELDFISKEDGLRMHYKCNFYPQFPQHVVEKSVEGFKLYWGYQIDIKELVEHCHMTDVCVFYKYFSSFLNEEDLEE